MKKITLIFLTAILFSMNGWAQCTVNITQTGPYEKSLGPYNDTVYCYSDAVLETLGVSVSGGSGDYTYKWYSTTDVAYGYNDNNGNWTLISGATGATYSPLPVTQSIRYKRVTQDVNCPSLTRNDFSYVLHLYKVDQIEASQKTCSPIMSASITDQTGDVLWKNTAKWYTVQWQSGTSASGTFTPIAGATDFLYTPDVKANDVYYRRSYSIPAYAGGTCATQLSNAVIINAVSCLTFNSSIKGSTSVDPGQSDVIYSVPEQTGMTYVWSVSGGTITGGQDTYTITVTWDGGSSAVSRTTTSSYSVSVTETNEIQQSQTLTQNISKTSITTAINKPFTVSGISMFPNPSKDQLTLVMPETGTNVNYTIHTVTGTSLQSGTFTSVPSGNAIFTNLPAGMYELVLNYDGGFTSTRLAVIE